jgi:hypothetical protein
MNLRKLISVKILVTFLILTIASIVFVTFIFTELNISEPKMLERVAVGVILGLAFLVSSIIICLIQAEFAELQKKNLVLEKIVEFVCAENESLKNEKASVDETDDEENLISERA